MSRALYFYANKRGAGSLVVALGLMQLLKKRFAKVAFFRPIVEKSKDEDIELIHSYFQLLQPKQSCYGVTIEEAEAVIAKEGEHALYKRFIEQFQTLQREYDFVLCEGIYSELFSNIVSLDINIEIAQNLSTPLITLLAGEGESKEALQNDIELQKLAIKKASLHQICTIINRCDEALFHQLQKSYENLFMIPTISELAKLSLADIIALDEVEAVVLKKEDYFRSIDAIKIAALGVENFLEKLQKNQLLILPGDRSEIILSIALSYFAKGFGSISGIVFSNDVLPHENIQNLLNSIDNFHIPLLKVSCDTFAATKRFANLTPKLHIHDTKKISLALGAFEREIASFVEDALAKTSTNIMTPMMFEFWLFEKAKRQKKRIVLPESEDERVLQAAEVILNRDIAEIIFVAKKEEFEKRCQQVGVTLDRAKLINPEDKALLEEFSHAFYELRKHKGLNEAAAYDAMTHKNYFATMMVHLGYADGMVSGAMHSTAETIRPALQIIKAKEGVEAVSSIFFMALESRVVVFGDCAIIQDPTPSQLASIAILANDNAKRFGIEPYVAMISFASGESAKGSDVEKVKKALELVKMQRSDIIVDGPMQFDAAFDKEVAKKKLPNSQVAGRASVFIFPDLNTGNTTYKAVQRSSGAIAIGPVLQGLKKPVNDLSRGCLVEDIINTIAITAIQAQEME